VETTNFELRAAAIFLLERHQQALTGRDMPLLEQLLRASRSGLRGLAVREVVAPLVGANRV
jgi:hypothetical protein